MALEGIVKKGEISVEKLAEWNFVSSYKGLISNYSKGDKGIVVAFVREGVVRIIDIYDRKYQA